MDTTIPFGKSYSEPHDLVGLLKSRGLSIEDDDKAEHYLEYIGYYRLSAYMYPLLKMPKQQHIYKSGATFDRVMMLYRFDKKLRLLLFNEIEKVEVAVRSAIVNIGTSMIGNPFWMCDRSNFTDSIGLPERCRSLMENSGIHERISSFTSRQPIPIHTHQHGFFQRYCHSVLSPTYTAISRTRRLRSVSHRLLDCRLIHLSHGLPLSQVSTMHVATIHEYGTSSIPSVQPFQTGCHVHGLLCQQTPNEYTSRCASSSTSLTSYHPTTICLPSSAGYSLISRR